MQCTSQDDDAEHDAMDGIIEEIRKLRPIYCMYMGVSPWSGTGGG